MKDKTEAIIKKVENLIIYTSDNKQEIGQPYHVIKNALLELKFELKDIDRWAGWFDKAKGD